MLSHVAAWHSTSARIALLETVQAVRDSSRIQILSALLKEILGQSVAESSEENTKLAQLVLDGYDRTGAASFEEQPDVWALFKSSLTANAHSSSGLDVRNLALAQLQTVLYSALPPVLKAEVVEVLVQTVLDPEAVSLPSSPLFIQNARDRLLIPLLLLRICSGSRHGHQGLPARARALVGYHRRSARCHPTCD